MQTSYAEILEDSGDESRLREREALRRAIEVMEDADAHPRDAGKRAGAIYTLNRLWSALLEDIASPGNALPPKLKAQIVSIGVFVLRHSEAMRHDTDKDFQAVIEITRALEKGLA